MPGIYLDEENRKRAQELAGAQGIRVNDLLGALLKQHGEAVAARIGKAQAALRGAVDGKARQ